MNRLLFSIVLVALSASLSAHHSPVMFDMTKTQTLEGTVVEFQWTNPHSSIQLDVQTASGVERWGVEMGSPNSMVKGGWKSNIIKAGDKVSVAVHPLKSGEHGGIFMSITLPDGRRLGGRAAE
jgi:Family of unknown function (DUF6152)